MVSGRSPDSSRSGSETPRRRYNIVQIWIEISVNCDNSLSRSPALPCLSIFKDWKGLRVRNCQGPNLPPACQYSRTGKGCGPELFRVHRSTLSFNIQGLEKIPPPPPPILKQALYGLLPRFFFPFLPLFPSSFSPFLLLAPPPPPQP